jgi:hypothetical protein
MLMSLSSLVDLKVSEQSVKSNVAIKWRRGDEGHLLRLSINDVPSVGNWRRQGHTLKTIEALTYVSPLL